MWIRVARHIAVVNSNASPNLINDSQTYTQCLRPPRATARKTGLLTTTSRPGSPFVHKEQLFNSSPPNPQTDPLDRQLLLQQGCAGDPT